MEATAAIVPASWGGAESAAVGAAAAVIAKLCAWRASFAHKNATRG
jgi:hypothetical protein